MSFRDSPECAPPSQIQHRVLRRVHGTQNPKTLNNVNPEHSRGVPKTACVILAAAAYRWSSDLLPLKSSEINPATKADAAAGDFARGS